MARQGSMTETMAASLRAAGFPALARQDEAAGRVFADPALPTMPPHHRREAYISIARCLAALHSLDARAAGIALGRPGDFYQRRVAEMLADHRSTGTSACDAVEALASWLAENAPMAEPRSVLHGDLGIAAFVFHPSEPRVIGVAQWAHATLGHPLADVADFALTFRVPVLGTATARAAGIPAEEEFVRAYCDAARIRPPFDRWNFFVAFALFKLALRVEEAHHKAGAAAKAAPVVRVLAEMGLDVAQGRTRLAGDVSVSACPFAARAGAASRETAYRGPVAVKTAGETLSLRAPFPFSERSIALQAKVRAFVENIIVPAEKMYFDDVNASTNRWMVPAIMERMKEQARAQGLWNLFLPGVSGLSNLDYAPLAEIMGQSVIAPEVFNCSAPDTGNMEVLHLYGSKEQKDKWLAPLLRGEIRSCFAMTEPGVASSDATNIACLARRDGAEWVINGRKWWSSGAGDPRCAISIVMCRTEDPSDASFESRPRHARHSMILVPMDAPGLTKVRPLTVFGYDDAPHGHFELCFENVRVPYTNVILGPGRGFEIAQGRLGPGRIHHCMRAIGLGERCLALMCKRVTERVAFGKALARHGSILQDIGRARIAIETARLLTLHAAHAMDTVGNKTARREIAMIKVYAPNAIIKLVDKAIQSFGAAGVSGDFPLAFAYAGMRSLRIADGPDEVHLTALGKDEIALQVRTARARL